MEIAKKTPLKKKKASWNKIRGRESQTHCSVQKKKTEKEKRGLSVLVTPNSAAEARAC